MLQSSTADLERKLKPFRHVGLARLPTPLEPLTRLTKELGGPRLWVKREDCTGLCFGGNKLRKLDYVLSEALALGAGLALPGTRILDIDAEPERVEADVRRYGAEAADMLGLSFEAEHVEVVAGHAGPAYGVPHAATLEAIRLAGRLEALVPDPVYSGKGLAGLMALIRQGRWKADEDVVFLHSGGEPAFFAYREVIGV